MTDLWTEATHDAEAEALDQRVTAARISANEHWAFLAAARTEGDYANRKALVADRLDRICAALTGGDPVGFGVVRSTLEARLDEDYQTLTATRTTEAAVQAEAARLEEAFRRRLEATLAARQADEACRRPAEASLQTQADGGYRREPQGNPDLGWVDDKQMSEMEREKMRLFPDGIPLRGDLTDEQQAWLKRRSSLQTQAEFDLGDKCGKCGHTYDMHGGAKGCDQCITLEKDDAGHAFAKEAAKTAAFPPKQEAPTTGAEQPAEQPEEKSGTVERKVELDPATGEYVGSEWEEGADGTTLVQSASTFGNNPRFKTEEEGNAWVAEGGTTEDASKAETEPAEQPAEDGGNPFADKGKTAANAACAACAGTGKVAAAEAATNEGYAPCVRCAGTGTVTAAKTAASKAAPAEGTVKDVGGNSLGERATCANCGKSISKGVAQRTTGWVHGSGSKWCPEGATAAKTAAAATYQVKKVHADQWLDGGESTEEAGEVIKAHVTGPEEEFWLVRNNFNGAVNIYAYHGAMKGIDASMPPRNMGTYEQFYGQPYREASRRTASWVDTARAVVEGHQHAEVDGVLLDATTANMLVSVHDALGAENRAKFAGMDLLGAVDLGWKLVSRTSASAEGDAVPFAREADAKEAFGRDTRDTIRMMTNPDYQPPAAPQKKAPAAPAADPEGSVTVPLHNQSKPGFGQGVPRDNGAYGQPGRAKKPEESGGAPTPRTEAVRALTEAALHRLADTNPYSTEGNPYVPPQTPPGTPDDVLDGPANPAPQMLDVPMTTRPRQMPSGDSALPPADDPAAPEQTKEIP